MDWQTKERITDAIAWAVGISATIIFVGSVLALGYFALIAFGSFEWSIE